MRLSCWKKRVGENTWHGYLAIWRYFTTEYLPSTRYKPEDLPKLTVQQASELAEDYWHFCQQQGKASYTVRNHYTALRSFFKSCRIKLDQPPRSFRAHRSYESDRMLKPEEIYGMIMAITGLRPTVARNRALIATWATTLQRRAVICALQFKHFLQTKPKDYYQAMLQILADPPAVVEIPAFMQNHKGKNVNKAQTKYRFAIVEDACKFLAEMLKVRHEAGEPLDNKDVWLFRSYGEENPNEKGWNTRRIPANIRGPPINAAVLNDLVVDLAEKTGIQDVTVTRLGSRRNEVHAHVNRRYGKDRMKLEIKDRDLIKFVMGQELEYEGAYDKYPRQKIRAAFQKSSEHLNFIPKPAKTEEAIAKAQAVEAIKKLCPEERERFLKKQLSEINRTF